MGFRIVIAGQSQCNLFAQICFVADHLSQSLPDFCYDRIEKTVLEWKLWLGKINKKNNWHHLDSPIVWKELLMKGSKPYYIGGASEFLDYCYSYYKMDSYMPSEKFEALAQIFSQYENKLKRESDINEDLSSMLDNKSKKEFTITISGAGCPLAMHLISGLLDISVGSKYISKIYLYDNNCTETFKEFVEHECSYVYSNNPGKVVKVVEKIGIALAHTDILIVLNHVPFTDDTGIGDWLYLNKKTMQQLAMFINASAHRKMCILFPNIGPACYNATILMHTVTKICKENIVVATSDLGLDIAATAAEIAEIPMRSMFCSPVWGFVGINHLVDIRTTFHKYNSFEPYNRYIKVKNSSLSIGTISPEMRTMEYLMFFDETLWTKVAERKMLLAKNNLHINKAIAALDVVKSWLLDTSPNYVVNLGIRCDGSFGLTFNGIFSQPSRFVEGQWTPANDFPLPRDSQVKLNYLEKITNIIVGLKKGDLSRIIPYSPCSCKTKKYLNKTVW